MVGKRPHPATAGRSAAIHGIYAGDGRTEYPFSPSLALYSSLRIRLRKNNEFRQRAEVIELFDVPAGVEQLPDLRGAHVFRGHFAEFPLQLLVAERVIAHAMRHVNALLKAAAVLGPDFRYALILGQLGICLDCYLLDEIEDNRISEFFRLDRVRTKCAFLDRERICIIGAVIGAL